MPSHGELVRIACRWLAKKQKCPHVFAEPQSMKLNEFPDAIGFRFGYQDPGTRVIEVKVSREDYRRDRHKQWKRFESAGLPGGMGRWRWYLVPDGLVRLDEIPDDHGLLYALPNGRVKQAKAAPVRESRDVESELSWLCTALQRHRLGVNWIEDEYRFETVNEAKAKTAHTAEDTCRRAAMLGEAEQLTMGGE
jgi:hypothetical protein